jgi:hypothetical protein
MGAADRISLSKAMVSLWKGIYKDMKHQTGHETPFDFFGKISYGRILGSIRSRTV